MTLDRNRLIETANLLHPATEEDLPAIVALERRPEFHALVGTWSLEEHARALQDADVRYFKLLDATGATAGFAILRGILSPHRSIELKRLVIGPTGGGLGQRALAALKVHVFETLGAHRFWLDVFETNHRAIHVYRKAGFQDEGFLREAIYRDGQFHTLRRVAMLEREHFSEPIL
jgi:RimJ/RimL family protein N-acetyltransferase